MSCLRVALWVSGGPRLLHATSPFPHPRAIRPVQHLLLDQVGLLTVVQMRVLVDLVVTVVGMEVEA